LQRVTPTIPTRIELISTEKLLLCIGLVFLGLVAALELLEELEEAAAD